VDFHSFSFFLFQFHSASIPSISSSHPREIAVRVRPYGWSAAIINYRFVDAAFISPIHLLTTKNAVVSRNYWKREEQREELTKLKYLEMTHYATPTKNYQYIIEYIIVPANKDDVTGK
ncbi:hypothetical protein PFISCL1PPCAC_14589, partial [Pristionchus fissidentatus]